MFCTLPPSASNIFLSPFRRFSCFCASFLCLAAMAAECPICFEPFVDHYCVPLSLVVNLVRTSCGHRVHEDCMLEAMESDIDPQTGRMRCCICRREFDDFDRVPIPPPPPPAPVFPGPVSRTCQICGQQFAGTSGKSKHMESAHPDPILRPRARCPTCNKPFATRQNPKRHRDSSGH